MKTFIVRKQKYPTSAFQVAGYIDVGADENVVCSAELEDNLKELKSAVRYLISEKAAISVRTVSGFEVERTFSV